MSRNLQRQAGITETKDEFDRKSTDTHKFSSGSDGCSDCLLRANLYGFLRLI